VLTKNPIPIQKIKQCNVPVKTECYKIIPKI